MPTLCLECPACIRTSAPRGRARAPSDGVRALVEGEPHLEDVVRVAARFAIAALAALYRFRTLDMVGDRRYEQLHGEIDDKLHHEVWDYLAPTPLRDTLAGIEEHP